MRLLKPALLALFMLCPWLLDAQVPVPQLNLSGNIGCIGFPCVNTGTFSITSDADTTLPITSTATSAFYLKVTSTVSLTATRKLNYPAGQFPVGIENATTGGQALSVCGPSGACVSVPNSRTSYTGVWNDGTNFVQGFPANAVLGTGITGDIPLWSGTDTLGNSPLSVSNFPTTNGTFASGTFYGGDVCWHYESGNTPLTACLRYAGHGNYYGPYNTNDGTTFTPTPFSVGQLNIGQSGATGVNGQAQAPSILFYENDTDATGPVAPVMATIAMYQAQPTGACPNAGVSGAVPVWGFAPDETVSFCTNAASSTWSAFGGSLGFVALSPSGSQTIAQPVGTTLNVTGSLRHDGNPLLDGPFNKQVSLGDSITFGVLLISRYSSYPSVIGNWMNVQPNNLGVSGVTCGTNQALIFSTSAAGTFPQTNAGVITYQIGTNDANLGGVDANQAANYGGCITAEGAFVSIPTANKVLASAFTKTGTWTTGVFTPDIATTTPGSTASFSVTGSVIYLATTVSGSLNPSATATLTCDGTPTGATLQFTGAGAEVPINSAFTTLTRVSGLTNTTHACTVANTGSAGTVELSWAAGLSGAANPSWPYLFQGGIPDQNPAVPSETNLYRAYIPTMVSTLSGDGLNVFFANTNATLTVPTNYVNNLHPNEYGQYLLGTVFINEIKTVTGAKAPVPTWYGGIVTSDSTGGAANMILGQNTNTGITGGGNTALGYATANALTTGINNTMSGFNAGFQLTTGSSNLFDGERAGFATTTGSNNVLLGLGTDNSGVTESNVTAVGFGALGANTASGNTCVGANCGVGGTTSITVSTNMTLMGFSANASTPSATVLTGGGAFGFQALVGASGAYEIGTGTCATANTFCFQGFQFLTSAGVGSFATGSTVNSSPICTTANGACSATSPLFGMTASQVPIAATATTVTSSKAIAGSGAGLTSGPTSATATDLPVFTSTTGGLVDSGVAIATLAPLASPALTGTPTAPTATVGTNTTQVATTAFVLANAGGGGTVIISPTTVSCTTSGSVTVTGTSISTYDKEILILLNSCSGGVTINYPAFTNIPSLFAPYQDGSAIPCVGANVGSISTTSATIIFAGAGACAPGPSSNAIYAIKGW